MNRLDGKVALLSGAARGIGGETAKLMAAAGASVVIGDLLDAEGEATVAEIRKAGGQAEYIHLDVTSEPDWQAAIARATGHFGKLDILVNNAGVFTGLSIEEATLADWQKLVAVNMTGVFLGTKLCAPALREAAKGSPHGSAIVNLASTSGIRWTGSAQVAYAACKAAVIQLGRVVAVQYAARGIRVNTVVPGQMHTPMVEVRLAGQRTGGDVEALIKQRVSRIPMGFAGDGRDTANAILFLASDDARFITGTELVVDGGMSVRCG